MLHVSPIPLLLFLSSFLFDSSHASLTCYQHASCPAPNPSDCAHLLAHIPRPLLFRHLPNPDHPLSNSVPFFPDASFRHRTCVLVLRAWNPLALYDPTNYEAPTLHESTLFYAWRQLITNIESIQSDCAQWGRGGRSIVFWPDIANGRGILSAEMRGTGMGPGNLNSAGAAAERRLVMQMAAMVFNGGVSGGSEAEMDRLAQVAMRGANEWVLTNYPNVPFGEADPWDKNLPVVAYEV